MENELEPVAYMTSQGFLYNKVSHPENYIPLYTAPPQRNDFNPDWDAMAVMVEEQQRMAKRIEELEAALAQREWVGLTDDEYETMAEQYVTNCYFDTLKYAQAIEALLKEKNNG